MHTHFKKQTCPNCHSSYDGQLAQCPSCSRASEDPYKKSFKNFLVVGWARQAALFLVGWAGFQLIALLVQIIYMLSYELSHSGTTAEELTNWLSSPSQQGPMNFISYGILLCGLALILFKSNKDLFKSFAKPKTYIWGVCGFVGMLAVSILYSVILNAIIEATGGTYSPNANQSTLESIIKVYPVMSLIIFGIVGPLSEELTYRVGLFSFCSRINKVFGYVVSLLIFALIHFSWTAIGTEDIVTELYNLPSYLIAGFGLAFIYDKGGIGASFLTHSLNNIYSVISTIVSSKASL